MEYTKIKEGQGKQKNPKGEGIPDDCNFAEISEYKCCIFIFYLI